MESASGNSSSAEDQWHREVPVSGVTARTLPADLNRVAVALAALMLVALVSAACSTGLKVSPTGAQEQVNSTEITVPDDISDLDADEVERRLGRLLGGDDQGGQAAPRLEPTSVLDEPTLQEILDLLDPANQQPGADEIVISVSPQTLSGLIEPVLTIKSQPTHGSATVIGTSQILYVADGLSVDGDSFEYELFDGSVPVFSQVVEIR